MNKLYLALSTAILSGILFGQEKPGTALPSGAKTAASAAIKTEALLASPVEDGIHDCSAHNFTQEHYESRGLWEEFQADYLATIEASHSLSPMYRTPGVNTISIIFHVVHNPDNPAENVAYSDIMNMYDDLVEDYQKLNADTLDARSAYGFVPANPNINFCLATSDPSTGLPLAEEGVIRVSTTEDWYDSDGGEENKMKASATGGSQIWDRNDYLNVWICDISNGASSGVAGYAYRPTASLLPSSSIDGIVIDYNLGVSNENILTHEVGHYLGLDHTWGGSGSCFSDDGFGDTPNTAGPSFNYSGSCSGFQETCSGTQTQYENYMDYSNCTCMFTEEQADYMLTILTGIRSSLLASPGCDPVDAPPVSAFDALASGSAPHTVPIGGAISLIDESTNVPTSWAWNISGTEGVDWDFISGTDATTQNPVVEFYNVGFYDIELTASNAFGADATPADSIGFVEVVAAAVGTACDTLRNYDPSTENLAAYILDFGAPWADWGYMPAHGAYDFGGATGLQDITHYADLYNSPTTSEVRRINIPILQVNDESGTGEVRIAIHNDDIGGEPGTEIVEDTFALADMNEGFWNEFDFTVPASVTGNFWVSLEFDYGSPQDTVVFGCVNFTDRAATTGLNTMYMYTNGAWYQPTDLYAATWTTSLYMDVLLSNGDEPVADFDFSESEICVGGSVDVNGAISTNVTDYLWYQTTDPAVSPVTITSSSTDPATTFTFSDPAGDYGIYLLGDGSCKTSAAVLTVTVNEPVTFTSSITHTTCGYNNGIIDITAAGGDGVYEYSIDGGASFIGSGLFEDLPAGDYDLIVRTNGDACEATATVTINSSATFTAGISPSTAICPGETATLTASGGLTYDWYDGGTSISTAASVDVTPAVTTTYNCIVTDAIGCQSSVFSTVTVNPLDDASFNFYDFCFGAPNGPVDIVTSGGTFSFSPDPGDGASINPTTGEITSEVLGTTYTVLYEVDAVCANSFTETTTVNAVDDASFVTNDYCDGDENVVSGVATPGGTFSYDGSDGSSINPSTGVITGGVVGTSYTIIYTTPPGICSATSTPTTIEVLPNPVITLVSANDPLCNGEATGSIDITVTGATPDSFDWGSAGTSEDPSGLTAGTYNVIVDAAGCTASASYTLTEPAALVIDDLTTTNVLCNGDATGTAITTASGGTGSLTYDYGAADESALSAGVYSVTVTDINGCTISQSFTINEPSAGDVTGTVTHDTGTGDGSIDITITGGTPPYDPINWDNGATTEDLTGLSAGTYTVTVTDANGCEYTATFTILQTVGINENKQPLALTLYPNPTTGELNIVLNGSFNFQILDARGRVIMTDFGSNQSLVDLSNFESGVYFIQVTQASKVITQKIILK